MTMVDAIISHINPSGYSYWSSDLNETTRIAPSSNHVPYSVTLSTKGQVISWLSTRAPLLGCRRTLKPGVPLYTTFVVYLTTIDGQYFQSKNFYRFRLFYKI